LNASRRGRTRETPPHSWGSPREGCNRVPSSACPPPAPRASAEERRRPRPARAHPSPASYPGPTGPALRANPFPEVTDPICRLPLPTLFYRLEAVHLGDLLRIWVRPGTKLTRLRGLFKGRRERTGHRKSRGALRNLGPYLRASRFQGGGSLQRKENSSRGSRRRPPLRLRYRTWLLRANLKKKEAPRGQNGVFLSLRTD